MRKWWLLVLAVLCLGASVALVLPRAHPEPTPAPSTDAALPTFEQVQVTSSQPSELALSGRVLDSAGKPVPNATVSLSASAQTTLTSITCADCGAPLLSCEAGESAQTLAALLHEGRGVAQGALKTTTDAEGRFRFSSLVGVSFTVWAEADQFGAAIRERAAPGDPVELFLPPLRTITGTIKDDFGRPIPDAHVHVVSRRLPLATTAKTRADGVFEVRGLGDGPFYVVGEAPGFLPAFAPNAEAGPKPVALRLTKPRTLEVSLRVDGKPVEGNVHVSASHVHRDVKTKDSVAKLTGLFPEEVTLAADSGKRAATPRLIVPVEEVTRVTLNLEAGGVISVSVVDENGQPVPDPELSLGNTHGDDLLHRKFATGELAQLGPVAEGDYVLRAWAETYQPVQKPVKVTSGEASIEVVLTRGTTIRGKVIDEYERPAPNVSVLVNPTGAVVYADRDGRFVVSVPTPGLYTLHAHHSDWGGGEVQVQAPADDVRLALEPKGGLEITVMSEGRRVEGADAIVYVDRNDVFRSDRPSGADGVVLMRGLPAGSYWVVARHPDYLPSKAQQVTLVDGPPVKITANLEPGQVLRGDVVDEEGLPVNGAYVTAYPSPGTHNTYTDGRGHFELHALRADVDYHINVQHPDYDQPDRPTARAGGDPVRIVMKKRHVYTGEVASEDGAPVKHFRIDDHTVDSPDGHFEVSLTEYSGRVIVSVDAPGYEPVALDKPAEPRELGRIVLKRLELLQGLVRDASGAPAADAIVGCDMCDGEVTTGADGRFSVPKPVMVESIVLNARKGQLSGSAEVNLSAKQPIEIRLQPRTHVTGAVYLPDGSPGAGVEIEAIAMEQSDVMTVVTGRDGRFATELPPGHYRFTWGDLRQMGAGPVLLVEIGGAAQNLDLGPAPGTSAVSLKLVPEGGFALWVVRGSLPPGPVLPQTLNTLPWAQFVYQPHVDRVLVNGLAPGHYTVVWASFHNVDAEGQPRVVGIDVPVQGEIDLSSTGH